MVKYLICLICFLCSNLAAQEVHVAFLGDSSTETSYLAKKDHIDQLMAKSLNDHYKGQKIITHNVSRGGATVQRFMKKGGTYETRCQAKIKHIDICFIKFAGNDESFFTPAEFKSNLSNMCKRVQTDYPGVAIILSTGLGYKDANWWKMMGKDAEEPISKKYYSQIRALAKEQSFPLVEIYYPQMEERAKGNWDMTIRNQALAKKYYGKVITDSSKDEERKADGIKWFKDGHPSENGMKLFQRCMMKTLTTSYPKQLPRTDKH